MKKFLGSLFTLLSLLVLAGCGSSAGSGSADADPAAAMPANAPVYLELVLRPEGAQREKTLAFAGKVLQTDDPEGKIRELLDKALASDSKADYEKDVEPWLGKRAGLYLSDLQQDSPTAVVALAAKDSGKAEDAIKAEADRNKATKSTYNGVTIYNDAHDQSAAAPAGDYVLFAESPDELHAAIDTIKGKPSLAASDRYKGAIDGLPGDRMGLMYLDTAELVRLIGQQAAKEDPSAGAFFSALGTGGLGGAAAALLIDEDQASIEVRSKKPKAESSGGLGSLLAGPSGSSALVRDAPDGSIVVIGVPQVGRTLKTLVTQLAGAFGGAALTAQFEQQSGLNLDNDVYGWMGDLALFVRGSDLSNVDGGVIIGLSDPARAKSALPKLVAFAKQGGDVPLQPTHLEGAEIAFKAPLPAAPQPLYIGLGGDKAVIALGSAAATAALKADKTIADGGLYDRAKDAIDGIDPSLIVDAAGLLKLIEGPASGDPDFAKAKPYLDMFELIAAGSKTEGDQLRTRVAVKLR